MARIPIRLAVLITRRAISPRLATRTDSMETPAGSLMPGEPTRRKPAPSATAGRRLARADDARGGLGGSPPRGQHSLLQAAGQALPRDFGERLDDARVVLGD